MPRPPITSGGKLEGKNPLIPRIEAPVLLIHGEKDCTFPVEQAKRLYGALPPGKGSELLTIPEAGHAFNFIEEKGKFA